MLKSKALINSWCSLMLQLLIGISVVAVLSGWMPRAAASIRCYSCSTEAGDRYCTEDNFNGAQLVSVQCPIGSDVCVRAIQIQSGGTANNNSVGAGTVFRSCGSSQKSMSPEITALGYFPVHGECVIQKIRDEQSPFKGSTFQICSCATDLSNEKGEMNCKTVGLSKET